ncbi:hypothetical protein BZG36_01628 [Bifiguratus adelaidae]|uniref:Expansin-like EG45 domain-containing protein n=1 Tax=Bifiguratus adelaidae TaxID=1938954 RepID=A0A261Y4F0_9FUNG|nr:hypothetical protein BZG36_01628 [Bifiguratus adelaidae]
MYQPHNGTASITHYDLSTSGPPACGCVANMTKYPMAAMNQNAYGATSNAGPGPACGQCYNVTIFAAISTHYNVTNPPSIVVKIGDECPNDRGNAQWCAQTDTTPNHYGTFMHFDFAQQTLPPNFWPNPPNVTSDLGEWWGNYTEVDCKYWAGYNDSTALGAATKDDCCPANPMINGNYCPFQDGKPYNGTELVPSEQISGGARVEIGWGLVVTGLVWLLL